VHGGGTTGQAGAIRHGIARASLQADADYKATLKASGFLTRDPRITFSGQPHYFFCCVLFKISALNGLSGF